AARAGAPAGEWRYELVVCSGVPSPDMVSRLSALAADERAAISVVVVGDCPETAARFGVGSDDRLTSGPLGVDVVAQQLSVWATRALDQLFEPPEGRGPLPVAEVAAALAARNEPDGVCGAECPVQIRLMGPVKVSVSGLPD